MSNCQFLQQQRCATAAYQSLQTSQQQKAQYPCLYYTCQGNTAAEAKVFSRAADLRRHVDIVHNRATLQLIDCEDPKCHRKGQYGFTRKDKMIDHMREVHKKDIPKRASGGKSS